MMHHSAIRLSKLSRFRQPEERKFEKRKQRSKSHFILIQIGLVELEIGKFKWVVNVVNFA